MKRKKQTLKIFGKKTDFLLWMVFIIGAFFAGFYGIKIFYVLLAQPILTVYNAAVNLYIQTGDTSQLIVAGQFAKKWLLNITFFIMGLLLLVFHKVIKEKLDKDE